MVLPYSSTDMTAAWKNYYFILSKRSDFHTANNLSIADHALPMYVDVAFSRWTIATKVYEMVY